MVMLIDYSSLLFRTFHTIPATVPMNAVYGFLNMLARLLVDRRPDRLAVAVDDDWRPDFRVQAIPSYKAHRVSDSDEPDPIEPQEALGRDVLRAFGIAVVGAAGFEAEDVIATLAARARERVDVVSGDRDLFALVRDPDVRVLYPLTGVTKLLEVDEAEIGRRYGIPGRAYGDFALLRGDPSDGLPGVPGIGEKTAAKLIAEHGSLAAVITAKSLPATIARRLDAAREYLAAARRVVLPVANVPLPPVDLAIPDHPADPATLARLAAEHRLGTPVKRVEDALTARRGSG
jgi:5'-3' exonuclease